jgi:hypothetical protein
MIDLLQIDFVCPGTRLREARRFLEKKNLLAFLNLLENSNASDFDFKFLRHQRSPFLRARPNTKIVIRSASDGVAISSLPVAFYPDDTGGARSL